MTFDLMPKPLTEIGWGKQMGTSHDTYQEP